MGQSQKFTPAQIWRNRIMLLVLWFVPFGLMAIAGLTYYLVQQGSLNVGSKNNGQLIVPPINLIEAIDGLGSELWRDHWSMVVVGDGVCNQDCRDTLHLSRQLHIRLDKEADRVQRIYLNADQALTPELQAYLKDEHRYLTIKDIDEASKIKLQRFIDDTFQAYQSEQLTEKTSDEEQSEQQPMPTFFIVDPQGWAMMLYTNQHEGKEILADLKHLLKFSKRR